MIRALLIVTVAIQILPGCAARTPDLPPPPVPLVAILPNSMPDHARVCVPREIFRNEGLACMTLGQLRAQLRGRRLAAREGRP